MAAEKCAGGKCREKTSRSIVIEMQGHNDPTLKREHGAPQVQS